MDLIISIEEARELLGDDAKKMSDADVEQLIRDVDVMARFALKVARQKNELLGDMESTSV